MVILLPVALRRGNIRAVFRRPLLLAVLIYVTLDAARPDLPGAFVFEASDSMEAAEVSRGRLAAAVTLPPPTRNPVVDLSPRLDLRHRLPRTPEFTRLARFAARCLPRAICTPHPLSEDPH